MKGEFIALLKDINNLELSRSFLKLQCKLLESSSLASQCVKMDIDVKKFKELVKFTLAVHTDWPR